MFDEGRLISGSPRPGCNEVALVKGAEDGMCSGRICGAFSEPALTPGGRLRLRVGGFSWPGCEEVVLVREAEGGRLSGRLSGAFGEPRFMARGFLGVRAGAGGADCLCLPAGVEGGLRVLRCFQFIDGSIAWHSAAEVSGGSGNDASAIAAAADSAGECRCRAEALRTLELRCDTGS